MAGRRARLFEAEGRVVERARQGREAQGTAQSAAAGLERKALLVTFGAAKVTRLSCVAAGGMLLLWVMLRSSIRRRRGFQDEIRGCPSMHF